jgi:hypothetical protein
MPDWWPPFLLAVFVLHLPFFGFRYHRTRELRYGATTFTFVLLVITYALRVFAPAASLVGAPSWQVVRVIAWISAATSITLLVRHRCSGLDR